MTGKSFDTCFGEAFDNGLADVKFFVRRGDAVTADALKVEAQAFQEAIDAKAFVSVEAVD